MSIAGGIQNAIQNAKNIGAETIQIFGSSPRQWSTRFPKKEEIKEFRKLKKENNIGPVFLHGSYLTNIATPDNEIRDKSIQSLSEHLKIVSDLDADGLIFHIGTRKELDDDTAIKKCSDAIKKIFKNTPGKAKLIIENNAGEGKKIGTTPQEMGKILKQLNEKEKSRLAFCIDTAHALESGIIKKYTKPNVKKFIDIWEKEVGINKIAVFHANDSKTPAESKKDRHENIGEGYIGISGFKAIANEKRISNKPFILEVPGFDNKGSDEKNIKILRSCFQ